MRAQRAREPCGSTRRGRLHGAILLGALLLCAVPVGAGVERLVGGYNCATGCSDDLRIAISRNTTATITVTGPWVDWATASVFATTGSGTVTAIIEEQRSPSPGQGLMRLRLTAATGATGVRWLRLQRRTGEINPLVPADIGSFHVHLWTRGYVADPRPYRIFKNQWPATRDVSYAGAVGSVRVLRAWIETSGGIRIDADTPAIIDNTDTALTLRVKLPLRAFGSYVALLEENVDKLPDNDSGRLMANRYRANGLLVIYDGS